MKKILALLFALLATPVAAQTIPAGAWGSMNYWGVGGLSQVLAPGLAGQCLTTQAVGSAPVWVNCQVSSLSLLPSIGANSIMANNTLNFVPPQAIDVNRILDMVGYDIIRPPLPESIIYKSNVGPNFNWQTLPPGTTGSLLTSGGPTNPIFWAPSAAAGNLAAICTTVGAMLYFDTPSLLWKCLAPGTSGQLLQTGGAAANPSWLTVTLGTLGGVPSTRNVNTSAPLGGGGALSADLTLTCSTCATTTNGGALSATAPVTLSAAGVIAMTNQGTTTTVLHGNAAGNPTFGAVGLTTDVSGQLPFANGGCNGTTQQSCFDGAAPTATRAGDITYWNGTHYVNLAGNNSGTQVLSESSSGVPSWAATGSLTLPRGYFSGFTHSNDITLPNTVLDFTIGTARDSTNAQNITQASAFTKSTAAFVVGTGNGCMDTGAVANNSAYYTFVILRTDLASADYLCSLSPTAPTIPTNYTLFRRIGFFHTAAATTNILAFVQVNDHWYWAAAIRDVAGTALATTPLLYTLTVPHVQGVIGIWNALYFNSGTAGSGFVCSAGYQPVVSTVAGGYSGIQNVVNLGAAGNLQTPVDSSARISCVGDAAANGIMNVYTAGWIDAP